MDDVGGPREAHPLSFIGDWLDMCACLGATGDLGAASAPSRFRTWRSTWRLLCSSFLAMTCLRLRNINLLPKKELHLSLWVGYFKLGSNSTYKPVISSLALLRGHKKWVTTPVMESLTSTPSRQVTLQSCKRPEPATTTFWARQT